MIENLRNKFVENPESLKDFYNDLDKLIESKKDLNVFITYDKSFVDQQVEKLIEKAKKQRKVGKNVRCCSKRQGQYQCKRFEDDLWIKNVRGLCFNL